MNISLTKELEDYVAAQLKTGHYGSASEVIREALRTQIKEQRRALLNERIEKSEGQIARGEVIVADEAFYESKKKMIRDRYMRG
jgi:putative addiction module CopG family antidote